MTDALYVQKSRIVRAMLAPSFILSNALALVGITLWNSATKQSSDPLFLILLGVGIAGCFVALKIARNLIHEAAIWLDDDGVVARDQRVAWAEVRRCERHPTAAILITNAGQRITIRYVFFGGPERLLSFVQRRLPKDSEVTG